MDRRWTDAGRRSADTTNAASPPTRKQRWAHGTWNVSPTATSHATWAAWLVAVGETFGHDGDHGYENTYTLTFGPGDLGSLFGPAFWSAVSCLGLFVCLLLWQRAWPVLAWTGVLIYAT
jgi:hypothetical protein